MSDEPFIDSYVLDDDILVIKLRGSLDASKTEEFQSEVRGHLDAGKKKFIIDCSYLGFISSMGIGALIALENQLRRSGGSVKLAAVQSNLTKVLSVVRMDRLLGMYGDIDFAREAFHKEDLARFKKDWK